jgi:hypothetical protein
MADRSLSGDELPPEADQVQEAGGENPPILHWNPPPRRFRTDEPTLFRTAPLRSAEVTISGRYDPGEIPFLDHTGRRIGTARFSHADRDGGHVYYQITLDRPAPPQPSQCPPK